MLVIALVGIFVAALIAYGAFAFSGSLEARTRPRSPAPEPPPSVRVLHSEAEITEAVDRAIAFERRAARVVERRIASYHAARPTAEVIILPGYGQAVGNSSRPAAPPSEPASA